MSVVRSPKKHHYVPRLLLRNFTSTEDMLWTYSKIAHQAGIRRSKPDGVFAENELYTERTTAGEKDTSLEAAFGMIESNAAPVVAKLLAAAKAQKKPRLSRDEREAWDEFFIAQTLRTPDFTSKAQYWDGYGGVLEEILSELEKSHPISQEEKQNVFAELNSKTGRQNIHVRALRTPRSRDIHDLMRDATLATVTLDAARRSFAIGSNPVVKLPVGISVFGNSGFENWLPISPDVCVCMAVERGGEDALHVDDDVTIRAINMATYRNSSAICAASEQLLKSLVKAHRKQAATSQLSTGQGG